jgi:bifunctional non-homologous end joining protein LigD
MSLKRYTEKRSFDKTPEPAPSDGLPLHQASVFCVQRHHASHLHYDLRLEVGGALKSWAVPKGPTLDPDEKRLAMLVEDHPIEYGSFEGVIPKGNYGAGSVMLWDRGTYELLGEATAEEQLARGDFKFRLHGAKLGGDFAIVRIKSRNTGRSNKGNEWLLIKKRDGSAAPGWDPEDHTDSVLTGRTQAEIAQELEALDPPAVAETGDSEAEKRLEKLAGAKRGPMPKIVSPMLAELGKGKPPSGKEWLYEIKWDGVRALCFLDASELRVIARSGNEITRQYPELSVLPHHLRAPQAIVDGEIAALDDRGRPDFERLQTRMHVADAAAIARLSRSAPVTLFVFDLLYLDGFDLRNAALGDRKQLLAEILTPGGPIRYSEHFQADGHDVLDAARQHGLEGVVGKRASGKYESRRSGDWVKWKVTDASDFVICGFTAGDRHGLGALILGEHREGKLAWAGNVGTGFDRKMVEMLLETLTPLKTSECPFKPRPKMVTKTAGEKLTWVKPELMCEVCFANRTNEGRLRAPVFVRLREDLDPPNPRTELLDGSLKEASVMVDGHRLKLTHLDKVFYPADGYRKRDLLNYYDAVAPLILPYLKDRPLSLKRYPDGIAKDYFFQKNVPESFPKWLRTARVDDIRWVIGEDRATLLFLVNLGCIDHNPWMSRMGTLEHPDYLPIDLDPQECGYEKIVEAALWVRAKLDRAGLECYPKTTGGDGMHILVPLEPIYTYEQVRSFAQAIATLGAAERPALFTTPRAPSKRDKGKVYLDWPQIAQGKTIAAPYVLRAYPGAPVATPLEWSEVTPRLRPEQFHLGNALARFDRVGDLFQGVLSRPQRLEKAVHKLA